MIAVVEFKTRARVVLSLRLVEADGHCERGRPGEGEERQRRGTKAHARSVAPAVSCDAAATRDAMRIQLVPDTGRHEFLDLPWRTPLEEWDPALLTVVDRGISRHVVRFVERGGALYALKEINERLAHKEYRLLRSLRRDGLPAVEASAS